MGINPMNNNNNNKNTLCSYIISTHMAHTPSKQWFLEEFFSDGLAKIASKMA
jgi:hypothetical protein